MATRVIVDAGHGGWDNGAMYDGRKEKDDTLKLAFEVGKQLEKQGIDVVYTRTDDRFQSPNEKARIGNASGVDFFLSLHRNASPMANQYAGVQTLLYNDGDIKEVLANNINKELEEVGFDNLGRSIRPNLAVLRRTNMPSVLVEVGFINTDSDNKIFDEKFDEVAKAIADGVVETITPEQGKGVTYQIQVGLFRNYMNAQRLAEELSGMGYTVEIKKVNEYYAVLVGRFTDMNRAERIETILLEDGYDTWIVAY